MSSPVDAPLRWRPSPLALGLATAAGTALVLALLSRQWALVVFAAPMLGALGSRRWHPPPPPEIEVRGALSVVQCFEGEPVDVQVHARAVGGAAAITLQPSPVAALELRGETTSSSYRVVAPRWGCYRLQVQVTATAAGGLLTAHTTAAFAQLRVYPVAPAETIALPHSELTNRLGTHLSRQRGPGVEYAGIRPYVPGDQLRSVNWPVTARRGQLQITERFTDRAAEVVAIIDTYPQEPGPATAALELAVRGATQVAQSALQHGDRTGVVALGARVRWLGADAGRRQFYRVLDTVLDFGEVAQSSPGTLAPRQALPPRAMVIAFSPLVRTDFTLAMLDLRRRGHTVVVVDVLRGHPFAHELDPVAARLWRLERKNVHRDLGLTGIEVVAWPADTTLEANLGRLDRRAARR